MKKIQSFLLFSLTFVFLVSTVGVGIFSHSCKVDGNRTSYFVPVEHDCSPELHEETHACCKIEAIETADDGCCSDQQLIVQLKTDIHSTSFHLDIPIAHTVAIPSFFSFRDLQVVDFVPRNEIALGSPPPQTDYNQSHLILFQQFLI